MGRILFDRKSNPCGLWVRLIPFCVLYGRFGLPCVYFTPRFAAVQSFYSLLHPSALLVALLVAFTLSSEVPRLSATLPSIVALTLGIYDSAYILPIRFACLKPGQFKKQQFIRGLVSAFLRNRY